MDDKKPSLLNLLKNHFGLQLSNLDIGVDMVTAELLPEHLLTACMLLRDESLFKFEILLDACGVDYLHYGKSDWSTEKATHTGFSRARHSCSQEQTTSYKRPRFAMVYHLLSITHNHRLRLKVSIDGDPPIVPSLVPIWNSADWYEREAYDLFGIVFEGHPDLRRLLTDYGFVGHPFRKDFPLIGEVELRYDAKQQRCVYEPVSIQPRVLVPKVIRTDNRYGKGEEKNG